MEGAMHDADTQGGAATTGFHEAVTHGCQWVLEEGTVAHQFSVPRGTADMNSIPVTIDRYRSRFKGLQN